MGPARCRRFQLVEGVVDEASLRDGGRRLAASAVLNACEGAVLMMLRGRCSELAARMCRRSCPHRRALPCPRGPYRSPTAPVRMDRPDLRLIRVAAGFLALDGSSQARQRKTINYSLDVVIVLDVDPVVHVVRRLNIIAQIEREFKSRSFVIKRAWSFRTWDGCSVEQRGVERDYFYRGQSWQD